MASRRCDVCDVNFPTSCSGPCPICGRVLQYQSSQHDVGWEELVPVPEPDLPPAIHPGRIVEFAGECWIHDRVLVLCGYGSGEVGMILRVSRTETGPDSYFEIMGTASQVGVQTTEKGWWLRRVIAEDEFKDLPLTGVEDGR